MPSALVAALEYAALGYQVLPIAPGSKQPIGYLAPKGLHSATTSPRVVEAWFAAEPAANLAVVPPVGVAALDLDRAEDFERFFLRWPALSQAPHSRTPRGGAHLYLRIPEGVRLVAHSRRGLPAFEVKRSGRAYLLEYPSVTDRGTYEWAVPLVRPDQLAMMPYDLLAQLRILVPEPGDPNPGPLSQDTLEARLHHSLTAVRLAQPGTRHVNLVREAARVGGLLPRGLDERNALKALLGAALEAGLPRHEAIAAIRWGLEAGKQHPARLEELPPRLRLWLNRGGVRRAR
jgi:hypothetical protein